MKKYLINLFAVILFCAAMAHALTITVVGKQIKILDDKGVPHDISDKSVKDSTDTLTLDVLKEIQVDEDSGKVNLNTDEDTVNELTLRTSRTYNVMHLANLQALRQALYQAQAGTGLEFTEEINEMNRQIEVYTLRCRKFAQALND